MEEVVFSDIVNILAEDNGLVQSRLKFSHQLGLTNASVKQLMNNYIQGVITTYDLMYGILEQWRQIKGASATAAELRKVLIKNDFRSCSDKLKQFEESVSFIPPAAPKAATSGESKLQQNSSPSSTSVAPFGFKKVVTNFTGRDEEMAMLNEFFNSGDCPIVLLSGLGKIGKTQLATKFALSVPNSIETGMVLKSWLAGETEQSLQQSVTEFFKHLNLAITKPNNELVTVQKMIKTIAKELEFAKWVVVIDNVDEMYLAFQDVVKFIAGFGDSIFLLVTSRNRGIFAGELEHLSLSPLTKSNSSEFVKKSLQINDESSDSSVDNFCEQLGHLPLALSQAVAYIKQQKTLSLTGKDYSVVDYLQELSLCDTTSLNQDRHLADYPLAVLKVCNITFEKLRTAYGAEGELALDVLDIIAFLNPEFIWIDFLQKLFEIFYKSQTTCNHVTVFNQIKSSLELLLKYSLINPFIYGTTSVHRIVQLTLRQIMASGNRKDVRILTQFWTTFEPQNWMGEKHFKYLGCPLHTPEKPHLLKIYECSSRVHGVDELRASKLQEFFDCLQLLCTPEEYLKFATQGAVFVCNLYGKESVQYWLMEKRITERMRQEQLPIEKLLFLHSKLKLQLGEYHSETLSIIGTLFTRLCTLRRTEEALSYHRYLLKCFASIEPTNDETIAKIKWSVARALDRMQERKEAVEMCEHALQWEIRNLGKIGSRTLDTRRDIAVCLRSDGRYQEAKEKFKELISIRESIYGPENVLTLLAKEDLAETLEQSGEIEDSLKLMEQIAVSWVRTEGLEKHHSINAIKKIAMLREQLTTSSL